MPRVLQVTCEVRDRSQGADFSYELFSCVQRARGGFIVFLIYKYMEFLARTHTYRSTSKRMDHTLAPQTSKTQDRNKHMGALVSPRLIASYRFLDPGVRHIVSLARLK